MHFLKGFLTHFHTSYTQLLYITTLISLSTTAYLSAKMWLETTKKKKKSFLFLSYRREKGVVNKTMYFKITRVETIKSITGCLRIYCNIFLNDDLLKSNII